jgi:hypothetical protein
MCEYLSELCLVDVSAQRHPHSLLSAAVLHVALTALGRADTYPRALARHSRYKLEEVMPAARWGLWLGVGGSRLLGVRNGVVRRVLSDAACALAASTPPLCTGTLPP